METKQLAIFLDVCKTQSFSETSRNMYITRSAIVQHINKLEKYSGQWDNNLQNGFGVHIWYDIKQEMKYFRDRYIGQWKDGKRNGYGKFFYSNGSIYEGYWKNNKKEGYGIFTFQDRTQYIGNFKEDIMIDNLTKDQNGYRIEKKYINENIFNKEIKNNEGYEDIKVIDNDQEDDEEKEIGVNGGNEYLEGYVGNCEPLNERNGNCFKENIKFIEDDEEHQDDNELNNLGLMYME